MKLGPNSKPHRGNAGYVAEMKCKLGGHIVIYDREQPNVDIDADARWIVMHEPSSRHIEIDSKRHAYSVMQGVAKAKTVDEARLHADILPTVEDAADHEEPVDAPVAKKAKGPSDEERQKGLDRFLADPENEPTPEGKAALRKAFGL